MKYLFFTGVILVTILSTASSNKNVLNVAIVLQHTNVTATENGVALNKTKKEKYNGYIHPDVQKIWQQYLNETEITEFEPYQETEINKWTIAMGKESAVTETIEAIPERSNNTGIVAAATINTTPRRIGYPATTHVWRRQRFRKATEGHNPHQAAIEKKQKGKKSRLRFENFRQPYWADGDYVFLRTGSPTTTPKIKPKSTNPMEVFRRCDRSCNLYFIKYGKVCGHRYNMVKWKNEYKNFANMCDIDHENCVNPKSSWHPMYRGNCSELLPFSALEYDYMDIVDRGKKLAPYVYVPPTMTTSTVDPVDLEIAELKKQQNG